MDGASKEFITSYMENIAYIVNLARPMKHAHDNTGDGKLTSIIRD